MTGATMSETATAPKVELPPFGRFFLPGPTEVLPEVLEAQVGPMIGHRGPDLQQLMARIQPALQDVFRTRRPVYISASSATGLLEPAIRNGVRRKVPCRVDCASRGRFSKIARTRGAHAAPP